MISTVAGNGTAGFSGDNGPATSAMLNFPAGISLDASGNLYVAEWANHRVRKVSNGVITTVAGSGVRGFSGDNGPAVNARLNNPIGIAVDSSGNLYIADQSNAVIRKVSNGVITTIAGGGFNGFSGDNGPAINALLFSPSDLAVDTLGNLFIADYNNHRVRRISNGIITTVAGVGMSAGGDSAYFAAHGGDNGPATQAIVDPTGVAVDTAGNLYIGDLRNQRLRKVSNAVITTVAGNGTTSKGGDNGPPIEAQLYLPSDVAVDAAGNVFIADGNNQVIRKVSNGVITTVAGSDFGYYPGNVAVVPAGTVYFSTYTIGLGGKIFRVSDGLLTTAATGLGAVGGLAADPSGSEIYFMDSSASVSKLSNGFVTRVAGNGQAGFSGDNGPATGAQLNVPAGLALDSAGNLYIADVQNHRIRKVSNDVITTIVGNGAPGFGGDNGPALEAQLNRPNDVAVDAAGNLYIWDTNNHRIRKVSNGVITTIAGDGTSIAGGDHGPATNAQLGGSSGMAVDTLGRVFLVDNDRVRVLIPVCAFGLSSTQFQPSGAGGTINIGVQAPSSCNWFVSGLPSWITVSGASSGAGPGSVTLVAAPANSARNAIFSIGGLNVSITQAAPVCDYAVYPGGQTYAFSGGGGSFSVTANAGCAWSASGAPAWITITNGSSGNGTASGTIAVASNSGAARSATLTIAGRPFTIEQQAVAIPGLNFIGSMPHLAAQENWTTTFTLINKAAGAAQARLNLFGDPNGPLKVPLTFPQSTAPGPLLSASLDRALAANASLIVDTGGPQAAPVLVGSAQLAATGPVDGFAIFRQIPTEQEAVVPMETRDANSYLLAFDNTNGLVLGVALQNISSSSTVIPVVIRDDNGIPIPSAKTSISLGGDGHISFVLADSAQGFPETANKRGTIEFKRSLGGRISVLGLRFTPPNNALTTIPALANVGTGGGSIAHLASGGDGWETTFVLVNTGTNAAQITLSFFADRTGEPLSLPLAFPQVDPGTFTQDVKVTRVMAAGGTLIVKSSGAVQLLTGSAQLTTNGNVSGFVIFRHNNQEAVVPLESRNASGYIIAFDNTGGTATGVALNAVSVQQVNIPVVVRNEAGTQIGATDTITLAPNGHYAFTLANDRYPGTANIRGTLEFGKPANAQIGALGIRIPSGTVTTYTTLPALAK